MTADSRNRIALVTGGAGQLGRYVVERLQQVGASPHVPIFREDEGGELRDFLGSDAQEVRFHRNGDLTDPGTVASLFETIRSEEGVGPEIVLNLAGGFAMAPVEETEPEMWARMWQMNATTAFLVSRAAFAEMKERGWGRIVNVSAFPALDRGQDGLSAYGAAKAGVLNLTHTLAREGVDHGITVNAVLPSIIDTAANREAMPDADTSSWIHPREIARVISFLVSEDARTVNGAAIPLTLG